MTKYNNILTHEFLYKYYIIEKLSSVEIAKIANCCHSDILYYLKKHNIKTRNLSKSQLIKNKDYELFTYDFLYQKYIIEQFTINEISIILNTTSTRVTYYLNLYNIQIRTSTESLNIKHNKTLLNYNWIYEQYIINNLSVKKISQLFNISLKKIYRSLKKHNISIKSRNEYNINSFDKLKSFAYCFWYEEHYFASTAEYIFYKMEKNNYKSIKFQPFTYLNKRPDFLLDEKHILEIKSIKTDLTEEQQLDYYIWGSIMKQKYGYTYNIRYMYDEYPYQYENTLIWLRNNAKIGHVFKLKQEI